MFSGSEQVRGGPGSYSRTVTAAASSVSRWSLEHIVTVSDCSGMINIVDINPMGVYYADCSRIPGWGIKNARGNRYGTKTDEDTGSRDESRGGAEPEDREESRGGAEPEGRDGPEGFAASKSSDE